MPSLLLKNILLSSLNEDLHAQQADVRPTQQVNVRPAHNFSGFSGEFVNFVKNLENAGNTGYDRKKRLWFPHPSPEGKMPTIGYGHKIKNNAELEECRALSQLR